MRATTKEELTKFSDYQLAMEAAAIIEARISKEVTHERSVRLLMNVLAEAERRMSR